MCFRSAPNVLLIMTDDEGFGAPSTFGGVIPTPTLDRLTIKLTPELPATP
jgi:arylsulfatase A-like enzyme